MSVINKMLRDLDQRQAPAVPAAAHATRPLGSSSFPRSGIAPPLGIPPVRLVLLGAGLALVLAAGAAWWWQGRGGSPTPPAAARVSEAPSPKASAPASPSVPVVASAPAPTQPRVSPTPSRLESKPEVLAKGMMPPAPDPITGTREIPASLGLRMDTHLSSSRKAVERPTMPERAAPSAKPEASSLGVNEALERAQILWNAGSRDAALDLLQDAVAVAERQGAGQAALNPNLLPLVRELTRMQLSEARHAAVWELLTRLEPQLGNAPDLWAIRANAAQRLGRHQDSVHAYLVALQSRPNEQRWLLGAAVSLAALGQPTSAAEMADKARAVGVVSPEVLGYLRQQGVPLK